MAEEDHEWSHRDCDEGQQELADAAPRWRRALAEGRRSGTPAVGRRYGAFSGWNVVLCVEKGVQAGFRRLLEAGGARIVCDGPPFLDTKGVTHAFVNEKRLSADKVDISVLQQAKGVFCLKPDFIAEHLTHQPEPCIDDFLIPCKVRGRRGGRGGGGREGGGPELPD